MKPRLATLLLLLLAFSSLGQAQVQRWVDEKGVVHYGDRPPAAANPRAVQLHVTPAAPAASVAKPAAAPAARTPREGRSDSAPRPAAAAPGTIDRMLARNATAGQADHNVAANRQSLIAQCKANRGVDCDTPQGIRALEQANTPITREEQGRIARMRAHRATCVRGALGC